jgi:hypothetical protein
VGNNPDPVAPVRGADGGSRYTVPDSIIPERGKICENSSKPGTKETWHVFHDDDVGSYLANKSCVLAPQTRSRTFDASALASVGEVLAGEPSADGVDIGDTVSSKSVC